MDSSMGFVLSGVRVGRVKSGKSAVCRRGRVLRRAEEDGQWDVSKHSFDGDQNAEKTGSEIGPSSAKKEENRLFEFLNQFEPTELVKRFERSSSPELRNAFSGVMRKLLGSLSPEKYDMHVSTILGNLIALIQTCIMTGYMMRNAQYRLSLARSAETDSPLLSGPSSPSKLKGGSAILTTREGKVTEVDAEDYAENLQMEASQLREELDRLRLGGPGRGNQLAEFLGKIDPQLVEEMMEEAGPEVEEAVSLLVQNVIKGRQELVNPHIPVEASKEQLGQLLFYSLVSGYFLREAESQLVLGEEIHIPALMGDSTSQTDDKTEPKKIDKEGGEN